MVLRENKNNAYVKFGRTNKEYYSIFRNGLYTGNIRFLTHYVHITKCLLDTKYKQRPDHTVLNEVIRLDGTLYDTL